MKAAKIKKKARGLSSLEEKIKEGLSQLADRAESIHNGFADSVTGVVRVAETVQSDVIKVLINRRIQP